MQQMVAVQLAARDQCIHLDEAIGITARIPAARWGTVEVRPIVDVPVPSHAR
jgi:hypothetical protein